MSEDDTYLVIERVGEGRTRTYCQRGKQGYSADDTQTRESVDLQGRRLCYPDERLPSRQRHLIKDMTVAELDEVLAPEVHVCWPKNTRQHATPIVRFFPHRGVLVITPNTVNFQEGDIDRDGLTGCCYVNDTAQNKTETEMRAFLRTMPFTPKPIPIAIEGRELTFNEDGSISMECGTKILSDTMDEIFKRREKRRKGE